MTATAGDADSPNGLAAKLGFSAGQVVMEVGYDDDIDEALRSGVVWLLTPKPGRDGHVDPSDISDAAPTAGLQATSTLSASKDWQGTRLVAPKASRR